MIPGLILNSLLLELSEHNTPSPDTTNAKAKSACEAWRKQVHKVLFGQMIYGEMLMN